jgi:Uma2 family endonuclease
MAVAEKLTIEDFEKLPDELAHYHELEDGQLVDVSGNLPDHIELRDYSAARMLLYVRERQLGLVMAEMEYRFGDNAYGPDISFLGPEKQQLIDRKRRVQLFVPDLAVEVVSRTIRRRRFFARRGATYTTARRRFGCSTFRPAKFTFSPVIAI